MVSYAVYGISALTEKGTLRVYRGLVQGSSSDMETALSRQRAEHENRNCAKGAGFTRCLQPGFTLTPLFMTASRKEAFERELLETVRGAQSHGYADGAGCRGACFVQSNLPSAEKQALTVLTERVPMGNMKKATLVLVELLDRHAVNTRVRNKIRRHLDGTCWLCGGGHLAARCKKATAANGLRRRFYPSGGRKRKLGKGGGKKGSNYKSGQQKRNAGTGGGKKGPYKSGAQKRKGG